MALNKEPARKLRSREIAKVVSSVFVGFVDTSGAQAAIDALDHFIEHRSQYIDHWKGMERFYESAEFSEIGFPLNPDNPPSSGEKEE